MMQCSTSALQYICLGEQENPQSLLFILHGYGASAPNIAPLAESFIQAFPKGLFLVPQAPKPFPYDSLGAMWFEIENLQPEVLKSGLDEVMPLVCEEITLKQKEFDVSAKDTIVMGFSQGAMIALALNHYAPTTLAQRIVGFSGGLPMTPTNTDPEISYLLVHGDRDTVVPKERSLEAAENLMKIGGQAQVKIVTGLDHSINLEGVQHTLSFLTQRSKSL